MRSFYEPKLFLETPTWIGTQWRLLQSRRQHNNQVLQYQQEAEQVISYYESLKLLSEEERYKQQSTFASLARRGAFSSAAGTAIEGFGLGDLYLWSQCEYDPLPNPVKLCSGDD